MPLEPVYDNPDGSLVSRGATRGALARLNDALAPPPVSCLARKLTRTAKRPSMPRIASQKHEHKNNTTAITHAPRSPCPSSTTARRTPHLTAPQHTQLQHTHTHTTTIPTQSVPKFNYKEKAADWQRAIDAAQPRQHWGAPVKSLLEVD